MRTVKISELKAHLSANLRLASQGEEILVCDRDRPIAKLVPAKANDPSTRTERLIASGVMTPPRRPAGEPRYIPIPAGKREIPQAVMDRIWEEERGDW